MDGWCIGPLGKEFFLLYQSKIQNKPLSLSEPVQYKKYKNWLLNLDEDVSKKYWSNRLSDFSENIDIPGRINNENNSYKLSEITLSLSKHQSDHLKAISAKYKVTLNSIIQSVWSILLSRYNQSNDIIFGAVVSGRPSEIIGIDSIIGLFINTIPVRIKLNNNLSFKDLITSVQLEAIESEKHHHYSLSEINKLLGRNIINHIFVFENLPISNYLEDNSDIVNEDDNYEISNVDTFEQTNYDFNIQVNPGDNFKIRFIFNEHQYQKEIISDISNNMLTVLNQIFNDDKIKLSKIEILSQEDIQKLKSFNLPKFNINTQQTFIELFNNVINKFPKKTAVVFSTDIGDINYKYTGEKNNEQFISEKLTYSELNEKAENLSNYIRYRGVQENEIVAILLEVSIESIISILGVIKSGATFLPINPDFPLERITYMIKDCGCKTIITDTAYLNKIYDKSFIINLDEPLVYENNTVIKNKLNNKNQYIYTIYTSGTSGNPKGVLIKQKNLVNYSSWFKHISELKSTDKSILTSSFAFDLGYSSIFPALLNGCELHIPSKDIYLSPKKIVKYIADNEITYLKCTPSFFSAVLNHEVYNLYNTKSIRLILLGGEAIIKQDIEYALSINKNLKFINHYGPTEATIGCISNLITLKDNVFSNGFPVIGKPISNMKAFILDNELRLSPISVPGELCISGDNLALGYLNNPDLTADKFVKLSKFSEGLIYRTGDMAKWSSDGNILFMGRVDNQVKIRGYRVEPSEIRNKLIMNSYIDDAIVIPIDNNREKYLCSFYIKNSSFLKNYENKQQLKSEGNDLIDEFKKLVLKSPQKPVFNSNEYKNITYSMLNELSDWLSYDINILLNSNISLSENETQRYKRQMLLEGWGVQSQKRLKASTVFVAGAGGGASPTIIQLALNGFGKIIVCPI